MAGRSLRRLRRLNIATHRDFGYFFSGLIIIYSLSGIALNHVDEWNPDFIINKRIIHFTGDYKASEITKENITMFGKMVGEDKYKVFDAPTFDQVKIYYDNATLHLNFSKHEGAYESITRRPVFYHVNVIHKNSLKGWKWASDIFAVMLIVICITGLFILKGKYGFSRRGIWLLLAGLVPPVVAWIIHAYI